MKQCRCHCPGILCESQAAEQTSFTFWDGEAFSLLDRYVVLMPLFVEVSLMVGPVIY